MARIEIEKAIEIFEYQIKRSEDVKCGGCEECDAYPFEDFCIKDVAKWLSLAIEALKQEPKFIAKSDGTIEQILTREYGGWILVSKGLPKCNGVYEVTIQCEDGLYVSACYFDGQDTWHNDNRINFGRPFANDKVIAWMPKPEPYKEGSRDGA